MYLTKTFLTGLLVTLSVIGLAQDIYEVKYLGSSQGLSNNSIRSIYQDHQGFIWFGSNDGLNRYDGYEFKVYRNKISDSSSLPHNYISALNEDDDHNLWIGTGLGVVYLNTIKNVFLPLYYKSPQTRETHKLSSYVNIIEKDLSGDMLIGTSGQGLIIKSKRESIGYGIAPDATSGKKDFFASIQGICIDTRNSIWVHIAGHGLYQLDKQKRILKIVNRSIGNYSVHKMLSDYDGNIWIATSVGLLKYSITENRIIDHYNTENRNLQRNYLTSLSLDKKKLWIGSDGGGLDILDLTTSKIENINKINALNRLSSESILTIFSDKEDRKWIGTNKGGVNVFDIKPNSFTAIIKEPPYLDLSSNFITSFYEDQRRNVWIGTEGGGVNVWNRNNNVFKHYKTPAISSNTISSITEDDRHNIWLATFGGGVNKIAADGKVKHYKLVNSTDGYENRIAICIYFDSQKNLWATSYENGNLYLYNKMTDRFETFENEIGDLMSMQEDRENELWAGGPRYLFRIDKVGKNHQMYDIGKTVRAIYESSNGEFWIGSEGGGLIQLDKRSGKIIKRYSDENGLSSNTIMKILEDELGNLWISTSNGLNKFNLRTKKITNFYEADGLQGNQFSYRAAIKLKSGELAFGGNNGFSLFFPSKISTRTYFPKVVVTALKIDNEESLVNYDYDVGKDGSIQRLVIPFDKATLAMQFAALEFSVPNKIQYKYYLEGWDKDWNVGGASRMVTYNNIREGTYKLRLKSTNDAGIWNENETAMIIKILPPWYRSWWAYIFYIVSIAGGSYLFFKYRTNQEKIKYELKISRMRAEMREAELQSERMEKEIQSVELQKAHAEYEKEKAERETERVINDKEKEINQKRLSFVTNISHEFRTPLTMIINPVQDLMSLYSGREREELKVIKSNAARLLNLTDQLLLFRKIEEGGEKLVVSKFNFSTLCADVFYYFKYEARTKNITYQLEGVNQPIEMFGDRDKIEIMLYNLIANAFKYTPSKGEISIFAKNEDDVLEIVVKDTGAGIPENTGDAIFERFYQASGHIKLGLGIGLYMVKQFIGMHRGSITYESEVGRGTRFILKLPIDKTNFEGMNFTEDTSEADLGHLLNNDVDEFSDEEFVVENNIRRQVPIITDKKTILVVDDDIGMRNYVGSVLERDYIIYKAKSGTNALKIVSEKRPDLIISDISMPGMDGIELCRAIKLDVNTNHFPVILLTAHTSKEIELKGTEEGADYYITKPFNKELLQARVATLFKSRISLQQYFYDQVTLKNDVNISENVPPEYQHLLNKCIEVVEKHLDDTSFNIEMLAREMGMSYSNLYKRIKMISGQSVNSFIRYLRLRKAAELLITTTDSVKEVSYAVGFNDIKYFREHFIKLFNMKPTEYIKLYRGKLAGKLRFDESNLSDNEEE